MGAQLAYKEKITAQSWEVSHTTSSLNTTANFIRWEKISCPGVLTVCVCVCLSVFLSVWRCLPHRGTCVCVSESVQAHVCVSVWKCPPHRGTFVCVCVCCSTMSNSLQPHSFYFVCVSNILWPSRAASVCLGEHSRVCVCPILCSPRGTYVCGCVCVCVCECVCVCVCVSARLLSPWNSLGPSGLQVSA